MKFARAFGPLGVVAVVVLAAAPCLAGESDVRVVVGFKGAADADAVTRQGGEVLETDSGRRSVVARVAPSKVSKLRADASVAYVEEDGIVEALGKPDKDGVEDAGKGGKGGTTPTQPKETTPWGVLKVWSDVKPGATPGGGVLVAVVDTGIDLAHPDLKDNIVGNKTFVTRTSSGNDDNGHGTHVAGTVAAIDNEIGVVGVAPSASLYAVKVLDARGSGYMSAVADGIDWAVSVNANVINMSLGSSSNSTDVATACAAAESAGVLVVAAAGNSGDGSTSTSEWSYPAALASVVSVGSTTSGDGLSSFSNTNSDVEVSGPGSSVPSTYKGSSYATLSGTSMASPHAAGVAAVLWAAMTTVPSGFATKAAAVRAGLQTHVIDLGAAGRDNGFGFGRVDLVP